MEEKSKNTKKELYPLDKVLALSGFESHLKKTVKNILKEEKDKTLIEWYLLFKKSLKSFFFIGEQIKSRLTEVEIKKLN